MILCCHITITQLLLNTLHRNAAGFCSLIVPKECTVVSIETAHLQETYIYLTFMGGVSSVRA